MRRGLKDWIELVVHDPIGTAASSPMRRGLKGWSQARSWVSPWYSSIFPDEEGTERPI